MRSMNKILSQHQLDCVAAAAQAAIGQFCYPTGTGKTIAEAAVIEDHITRGDRGIYVVMVPRILLADQIFSELYLSLVIGKKINCTFFSLHSGKSPSVEKMARRLPAAKLSELSDQDDCSEGLIQTWTS